MHERIAFRQRLARRDFLRTAAAATVTVALTGGSTSYGSETTAAETDSAAKPRNNQNVLRYKGVDYDVGTIYLPGAPSRGIWARPLLERDFDAIRDELHCNSISVFGTQPERLIEAAAVAAERGLHVWIQPRPEEADPDTALANLKDVAKAAESLRSKHGRVGLNLGCEATLFQRGFIPGNNFVERMEHLMTGGGVHVPEYCGELEFYLKRARTALRDHFKGPLTYGAGPWEWDFIDWSEFDFVSIDHYMDAENEHRYVEPLRSLQRFGKPLIVGEFGCCTYEGAERKGGMGWDIIDMETGELRGNPVRSERVQAEYITKLLEIFREEKVAGAFVYQFIDTESVYSPNPEEDMDKASYAIVKVVEKGHDANGAPTVRWEPKQAYHEIARIYGEN